MPDALKSSQSMPTINVLSGAETLLDGGTHVGVAVQVTSAGVSSVFMISDVGGVKDGKSPVYVTKPIVLKLEKLIAFLQAKDVALPEPVKNVLKDANVSCNAFYFTAKEGPLLMVFALQFNTGLVESLTGDKALGELFDIEGAAVRVLRCKKEDFAVLEKYAAEL